MIVVDITGLTTEAAIKSKIDAELLSAGSLVAYDIAIQEVNVVGKRLSYAFVVTDAGGETGSTNSAGSQADGHSVNIGSLADADTASTLTGLLKKIKGQLAGSLAVTSAASTQSDGHSANIGTLADADTAYTLTGLLKAIKAAVAGTVQTSVSGTVATTNAASSQADGHSANIGTLADADTASTITGLLKKVKSQLSGNLATTSAAASQVDGHSANLGTLADSSSAYTVTGLLKAIKASVAGTLQTSVTGSVATTSAAGSQADGHSANIGTLADASSASTLTGLLKAIKAAVTGTLQTSVSGSVATTNAANSQADGHSANIGALADTSTASTLTGLLKAIKASVAGTLQTSVTGSVATTNAASSQADGHSVNIGALADADTASTLTGLLKKIKSLLPAALVGGRLDVNLGASGITLPVSQATASSLNATVVQGAGSGSAATYWYSRGTDGTNTTPTMDAVGRPGFQKITDGTYTMPTMDAVARKGFHAITDGTNTMAVKASATAATTTDPAAVVALSPNSAGTTPTVATVACATAQNAFTSNTAAKARKIYNRVGNGICYVKYGSATLSGESDCSFPINPGQTWEMPLYGGALEFNGIVQVIIPSGSSTINTTEVV